VAQIPSFKWYQADSRAINYNPDLDAWRAGIVKDILLTDGGAVLVAAQSGGIWSVTESGTGVCLLDSDHPDMWCLAQGTLGDDHCYAGGDTLFETDVSQTLPLLSWVDLDPRDSLGRSLGTIFRVVVLADQQIVVVGAEHGVYWSKIPAVERPGCLGALFGAKTTRGTYAWTQATGLPSCWYSGLVAGPPGKTETPTLVAAPWGDGDPKGDIWGYFVGDWVSGGNLHFTRADSIAGFDPHQMAYTVLAAHAEDPQRMYATSSNPNGNLVAFARSDDGGYTWQSLPGTLSNPTDTKTIYDACINQGNDHTRPCNALGAGFDRQGGHVAIGWRAGPMLSTDGGDTFYSVDNGKEPHLHSDLHCLRFTGRGDNEQLFIGSDGGVAVTRDFGQTYVSSYNRELLTLQLLGTSGAREWYGALSASAKYPGLVATGTQDNGNLAIDLTGGDGWAFVEGGDGRMMTFLANDTVFHYWGDVLSAQLATHSGTDFTNRGDIPYYQDRVLSSVIFEPVEQPQRRDGDGRLQYGVCGMQSYVYALVGDANGDNTHWSYVAGLSLGLQTIAAVSSRNGYHALAGTYGGRIFRVNPDDDLDVVEQLVQPLGGKESDPNRVINRIVIASDGLAFASYNATDSSTGSVLVWQGNSWQTVAKGFPNEFIYAMAIDVEDDSGPIVYVATDAKVYASADAGTSWVDVSNGLPRRPHCSDLRLVDDGDGTQLYLSTFGRSLWRADLAAAIQVQPR